jgi:ATP-dependent protease ClpP protease subunit
MRWYEFKNSATPGETELYLYNEIGSWGISAADFLADLQKVPKTDHISLHVHSPGGDVFDGQAIFTALSRHPGGVTTHIDGLAASMASVVALAGLPVKMAGNAMIMIHNVSGMAMGDSGDMHKTADLLDKVGETITAVYAGKTGLPRDEVRRMMNEETWMTATQAKAFNFVDEITGDMKLAAQIDTTKLKNFKNVPKNLMENTEQKTEDINQESRKAGNEEIQVSGTEGSSLPDSKPSLFSRVSGWIKDNAALVNENASLRSEIDAAQKESCGYVNQITEQQGIIDRLESELTQFKTDAQALEAAMNEANQKAATVSENTAAQIAALGFDQTKLPAAVPADAVKSDQDILDEYNEIPNDSENAVVKTEFYRKNLDALRRARAEKNKSKK